MNRAQGYEQNFLKSKIGVIAEAEFTASRTLVIHNIRTTTVNSLAIFVLVGYVFFEVGAGAADIEDIFVFYAYSGMFLAPLLNLPVHIVQACRELDFLEPILWHAAAPTDAGTQDLKVPIDVVAFKVTGLRAKEDGLKLPEREFQLEVGKIYHLKGENGKGKTTILNAISATSDFSECWLSVDTLSGEEIEIATNDRSQLVSYAQQLELN